MNYLEILHSFGNEIKSKLRKLENIQIKIINTTWSHTFNDVCLRENILPNYVNFRTYDPAIRNQRTTIEFKKQLLKREALKKEKYIEELKHQKAQLLDALNRTNISNENLTRVLSLQDEIIRNKEQIVKTRTIKKLNSLYHGKIVLKEECNNYVNLSSYNLSEDEKQFLNLGINMHVPNKYDKLHKETEIEMLYSSLIDLQRKNKINISDSLPSLLTAESKKHRNNLRQENTISPQLKRAAAALRDNEAIVIRKADKSSIYVV